MRKILLSAIIIIFTFEPLCVSADESEKIIDIKVYADTFINEHFYGFGAETLPWLWTKENKEAGIDEEDIRLNLERIREMNLSITRIFAPWETWNPSLDYKTFTWESDEMKSLYKILDVYQEMGTRVILVTVDWLGDSPWSNVKASAEAVLRLLEYLIRERGYSCIQFWTLTNEPELTYGWLKKMPFENYIQIHRLIKKGLKKRKLPVKIIVSDEVESWQWFIECLQSLHGVADIFSSHLYLDTKQINQIHDFLKERLGGIKIISKRDIPFFLCEFGFKGSDFGVNSNSLIEDYDYGLYVADLCIEALNSGVDAASLWCLHQIRLIDEINPEGGKMMRIGLWAYKDEDWRKFPIFYLYRLFTKYVKSGSKVLVVKNSFSDRLKAACIEYKGQYSLFIVNMKEEPQIFIVKGLPEGLMLKKYIYIKSMISLNEQFMNEEKTDVKVKNYLKDEIPSKSVLLFTSHRVNPYNENINSKQ